MDPVIQNWNELEKLRLGIVSTAQGPVFGLASVLFVAGLVFGLVMAVISPSFENILVLAVYALVAAYRRVSFLVRKWGVVLANKGKRPIEGAVVRLHNVEVPQLKFTPVVTKREGRYNFLVERGRYKVSVETKDSAGGYKEVYRSGIIPVLDRYGNIGPDIML